MIEMTIALGGGGVVLAALIAWGLYNGNMRAYHCKCQTAQQSEAAFRARRVKTEALLKQINVGVRLPREEAEAILRTVSWVPGEGHQLRPAYDHLVMQAI